MANGLSDGISGVLQRAGQIFHVFDLSFFASGAATFSAVLVGSRLAGWALPSNFPTWLNVVVFVFGSYIAGVASFAVGRQFRRFSRYRRTLHKTLRPLARSHGLTTDKVVEAYFDIDVSAIPEKSRERERNAVAYRLYSRLWAELRDNYTSSEGYRMLSRYWVMAAMYDGLVLSFLLWSAVAAGVASGRLGLVVDEQRAIAAVAAFAFIGLAYVCNREGLRNFEYQVEDICATFAARREPLAIPRDGEAD